MKSFCKRFWFAAMTALSLMCGGSIAVAQAPAIFSITVSGGQAHIACVFPTGDTVELQASSTVTGPWSLVGSATGSASPYTFLVPAASAQRFFRIRDIDTGMYSTNTAGYINLNPGNSWSLIANQLLGVARLQDLFPVPPDGTTVYKVGAGGVDCSLYDELGADWFDCATFNPSAMTLRPGEGAFFSGSQGLTETLVGEVPEGTLTMKLFAGFSLCSSIVPQQGRISTDLGFPVGDGEVFYKLNPGTQGYDVYFYDPDLPGWDPSEPLMAVGEAFWVDLPTARNWVRNFSVSDGGSSYGITNYHYNGSGPFSPGGGGTAPTITVQPQSRTNIAGSDATFGVTASGDAPLSYQWRFGNTSIGDATLNSYTISNVQAINAGNYSVIVSNPYGSITSAVAVLTVDVCTPVPPGIVAWWAAENDTLDSVGTNHGTLMNGAEFAQGKVEQAFSFDGVNAYLLAPTPAIQVGTADFSLVGWAKTTSTKDYNALVSFDAENAASAPALSVRGTGALRLWPAADSSVSGFNDGQFHHFAIIRLAGVVTYFKDGEPGGAVSFPNFLNATAILIGGTGYAGEQFPGLIDEVAIFNRALDASEIAAIYAAGSAGMCQTPAYINAQRYMITDLGTLGGNNSYANGINDYGQVVGWSDLSNNLTHAFLWSGGQITDLGTLGGANSLAFAINNRGEIVGGAATAGGNPHGFVWTNGVMRDVNPSGAPYSRVNGINETGDICGEYIRSGGTYPASQTFGFVLSGTSFVDLGTMSNRVGSSATSISHSRKVVGTAKAANSDNLAVLWQPTNPQATNFTIQSMASSSSVAYSINGAGQIGGFASPTGQYEPFIWTVAGSSNRPGTGAFASGGAYGISSSGQIVGILSANLGSGLSAAEHAFTYDPVNGLRDLNALVPTNSNWLLNEAYAVNSRAQIVGVGLTNGHYHAFLLTPQLLPVITSPPFSATRLAGTNVDFAVTADGAPPLKYQWRFNGTNLAGATNPVLTVRNVSFAQAGSYSVIVTNSYGSVTSAVATLTINGVSLDGHAVSGSVTVTNSTQVQIATSYANGAIFYTLDGDYPGTGQLYYGPFTLSSSAVLRAIGYSADYSVFAEVPAVNITVVHGPTIIAQPESQTRLAGQGAAFSVQAAGEPLTYQWYSNGSPIPGATSPSFVMLSAVAGSYSVVVSNPYGSVASDPATLTVFDPVTITAQPASTNVAPNTPVTFTVVASGSPPLQYQWRHNGANLPGKTNSTLSIPNAQLTDGGTYTVVVLNEVGSVISDPVQLTIFVTALQPGDNFEDRVPLPNVSGSVSGNSSLATKEPGEPNHAGKAGGRSVWYKWTAPASGNGILHTQGSSFDTVLAIYEGNSLTSLAPVTANDDGGGNLTSFVSFNAVSGTEYSIAIDGVGGAGGYLVLSWTLNAGSPGFPVILEGPQDIAVVRGNNGAFTVAASGPNLSYQWEFNDVDIANATNSTLIVSNVQLSAVGIYTVRVSSSAVSIFSGANLEMVSQPGSVTRDKLADAAATLGGPGAPSLQAIHLPARLAFTPLSFGIPGSQDFANGHSRTDLTDPALCAVGGASRWLIFKPSAGGLLSLDTIGTAPDLPTIIAVYQGGAVTDIVPANLRGCDVNSAPDGHSLVRIPVDADTSYSVLIDGTNGVTGLIHLNYCLGSAPAVVSASSTSLVREGGSLTLHGPVSAAVPAPSYQWYRNGAAIFGATQINYNLTSATAGSAGVYSVVASNCVGMASNVVARINLEIPLTLSFLAFTNTGKLDFHITSTASQGFMIQGTSNLLNWIPLFTNPTPFLPVNFADPASATRSNRFYRAAPWQP